MEAVLSYLPHVACTMMIGYALCTAFDYWGPKPQEDAQP